MYYIIAYYPSNFTATVLYYVPIWGNSIGHGSARVNLDGNILLKSVFAI